RQPHDLPGPHRRPQRDHEGPGDFLILRRRLLTRLVAEPANDPLHVLPPDALRSSRVVPGHPQRRPGGITAPMPLLAGDRPQIAQEVDLALDTPLGDLLEPGIPPSYQVRRLDLGQDLPAQSRVVPLQRAKLLALEVLPALVSCYLPLIAIDRV